MDLRDRLVDKGHIFTTASDSEVIVHAYEEYAEQCVHHFRGMFAFAIWDGIKNRLYLARDRFGKKPLFYKLNRNSLFFSSEIKSLLTLPNAQEEVNRAIIGDYLVYRYAPGPGTLFKNILKLEPGSYATYQNGVFERKEVLPATRQRGIRKAVTFRTPLRDS